MIYRHFQSESPAGTRHSLKKTSVRRVRIQTTPLRHLLSAPPVSLTHTYVGRKGRNWRTCDVKRLTTSGSSVGTAAGPPPTADAIPPRPPPAALPKPAGLCAEADAFAGGAEDLGASTPHPYPFPAAGGPVVSPPAPRPRRMLTLSLSPPLMRLDISPAPIGNSAKTLARNRLSQSKGKDPGKFSAFHWPPRLLAGNFTVAATMYVAHK